VNCTPEPDVGRALRALRAERGLSIRALAGSSGLAVNTLSLIENGRSSPSVSTLQLLARALGVRLCDFFDADQPRRELVFLAAGSRPRAAFAHGTVEDLGAGLSERGISPLLVTLAPGADSGAHAIVHTGEELVLCLEGRLEYRVDGESFPLAVGDSLMFAAHLPHSWRNLDGTPSRALLVLCPSDVHDRPTERHFLVRGGRGGHVDGVSGAPTEGR
jgi:transcriptional regulator with XRE-family HTH domain